MDPDRAYPIAEKDRGPSALEILYYHDETKTFVKVVTSEFEREPRAVHVLGDGEAVEFCSEGSVLGPLPRSIAIDLETIEEERAYNARDPYA